VLELLPLRGSSSPKTCGLLKLLSYGQLFLPPLRLRLPRAVDRLPRPADIAPAEADLRPGKRPVGRKISDFRHCAPAPRRGLLQRRPSLYISFQRAAAGVVTQMLLLWGWIHVSAPGWRLHRIVSNIPDFAHPPPHTRPKTGIRGCVRLLLYFSTKRETYLSICTRTV